MHKSFSILLFIWFTLLFVQRTYGQEAATHVYWTNGLIAKTDIESGKTDTVLTSLIGFFLQIDPNAGRMYWSGQEGVLRRADLDASSIESFHIPELTFVNGMVQDSLNGHLYWLDGPNTGFFPLSEEPHRILRTDLDGSNASLLLSKQMESPVLFQIDAEDGYLMWEDVDTLWTVEVNGSAPRALWTGINTFLLDPNSDLIYWEGLDGGLYKSDLERTFTDTLRAPTGRQRFALGSALLLPGEDAYIDYLNGVIRRSFDGAISDTLYRSTYPMTAAAINYKNGGFSWMEWGEMNRMDAQGEQQEELFASLYSPFLIVSDMSKQHLYWTDINHVFRYDVKTGSANRIFTAPVGFPNAFNTLAIDTTRSTLYLGYGNDQQLQRLDLATLEVTPVQYDIDLGIPSLTGHNAWHVWFDNLNDKLYWSNQVGYFRSEADGSDIETLSLDNFTRTIHRHFVDDITGSVYWSELGLGPRSLNRSSLDFSDEEELVDLSGEQLTGLLHDAASRTMYWSTGKTLFRSNMDSFEVDTIRTAEVINGAFRPMVRIALMSESDQISSGTENDVPDERIRLHGYPNPFSNRITMTYTVDTFTRVTIHVYDMLGRQLALLVDRDHSPGTHQLDWDGNTKASRRLPGGMYGIRVQTDIGTYSMLVTKIR